jgi:hypothetical protein
MTPGPDRFVTIATYTGPWEAHLARARLESEDIQALVLDDQIASINWFYSNAVGGVRLQVRESDREKALGILRTEDQGPVAHDEGESHESPVVTCPYCGGTNIRRERFSPGVAFLSFILFGLPFLLNRKRAVCLDCNRKWRSEVPIFESGRRASAGQGRE